MGEEEEETEASDVVSEEGMAVSFALVLEGTKEIVQEASEKRRIDMDAAFIAIFMGGCPFWKKGKGESPLPLKNDYLS